MDLANEALNAGVCQEVIDYLRPHHKVGAEFQECAWSAAHAGVLIGDGGESYRSQLGCLPIALQMQGDTDEIRHQLDTLPAPAFLRTLLRKRLICRRQPALGYPGQCCGIRILRK